MTNYFLIFLCIYLDRYMYSILFKIVIILQVTGALVLVEPTSGSILPVKLGSGVLDSVKDLKNRLTGSLAGVWLAANRNVLVFCW